MDKAAEIVNQRDEDADFDVADSASEQRSHQDSALKVDASNPGVRTSLIKSDHLLKNR